MKNPADSYVYVETKSSALQTETKDQTASYKYEYAENEEPKNVEFNFQKSSESKRSIQSEISGEVRTFKSFFVKKN